MKRSNWIFIVTALLAAGCASSNGGKPDSRGTSLTAEKRRQVQKMYIEGVTLHGLGDAPVGRCFTSQIDLRDKAWKTLSLHANGCVKAGDWRSLDMIGKEIARMEQHSPWGAYYQSIAAENMGNLPLADWMIELALKKAPETGVFLYQKGRLHWKLGNPKVAIDEISRAVSSEPKLMDAHLFLAQAHHQEHNLDNAADHYEAVLASDGKNRICLEGLADIRLTQGKTEKGVELLTAALSLASDDIHLRLKLALAQESVSSLEYQHKALLNYRAVLSRLKRDKKLEHPDFNLGDKIKELEAKGLEAQVAKTAQAEQPKAQGSQPQEASNRNPGSVKKGEEGK